MSPDKPVTQAELEAALNTQSERLIELMRGMLEHVENALMERMRDMQTEILRGFGTWAENQSLRLNKLEADHHNLDTSATQRLANVEHRLLEIEKRLLMEPPKPH